MNWEKLGSLAAALLALATLLLPWVQMSSGPMTARIQGYHVAKGSVNAAVQLAFERTTQAPPASTPEATQPAVAQPAPAPAPPAPATTPAATPPTPPPAQPAPVEAQPSTAEPPEPVQTVANERLGFRVTFPEDWSVSKQVYEDKIPDNVEEFLQQGGKLELGDIRAPTGEDDWNALAFNQGTDDPAERPIIGLYAIEREPRSFEEYSRDMKAYVEHFKGQLLAAQEVALPRGLAGYDFVYELVRRTRHTVFFLNGKRYGLTYSELTPGAAARADKVFEGLLGSFEIISKAGQAAAAKPVAAPAAQFTPPRPTAAKPAMPPPAAPTVQPPAPTVQPPTPSMRPTTPMPQFDLPAFRGPNLFVLGWAALLLLGAGLIFPAAKITRVLALAFYALGALALGGLAVTLNPQLLREPVKWGEMVVWFGWLWPYWLAVGLSLVLVGGAIINLLKGPPPEVEPAAFSDLLSAPE